MTVTIGELEKLCQKYKNKNQLVYIAVCLCEETVNEKDKPCLDKAKTHRFAITGIKRTDGPMYDDPITGPESDTLDCHHGRAIEIEIHQNESLRVHLSNSS